ncbi:uncharacterized protein RG961_015845 [Leptosomus discolor]
MAPTHRLFLLLLLVALRARAARAAPWRARGADEGGGEGYPASRVDVGLEPLGHPGDRPVLDGFPAFSPAAVLRPESTPMGNASAIRRCRDVPVGRTSPWLNALIRNGLHRRGPPRAKYLAEGAKKSLEPSEMLQPVQEEVFSQGSAGSQPGFDKELVATPATSTADALGNKTTSAGHPQSTGGVSSHEKMSARLIIGTVFAVISLPPAILFCFVMICWLVARKVNF